MNKIKEFQNNKIKLGGNAKKDGCFEQYKDMQRFHRIYEDTLLNKTEVIKTDDKDNLEIIIQRSGYFMISSSNENFSIIFFRKCKGEQNIIIYDAIKTQLLLNMCNEYSEQIANMEASELKILTSFENEDELNAYFMLINLSK